MERSPSEFVVVVVVVVVVVFLNTFHALPAYCFVVSFNFVGNISTVSIVNSVVKWLILRVEQFSIECQF